MKRLRNLVHILLCVLLGAVLTEGFLRVLIPREVQFETWFTPGIERWDPEFGAHYRGNWSGMMRHADRLNGGVPLFLDEHGFRLPARNDLPGKPFRVLLIGGRSAMMSYGLSDEEAIVGQLVENTRIPLEAQSIAWAGNTLLRSWNLYRRHLMDEEWDLVILSHVNPWLPAYANPEFYDSLPPPASPEWVFRYMDGVQLWRDGLFDKFGKTAFKSYLGYGLIRLADAALKNWEHFGQEPVSPLEAAVKRQAEPIEEAAMAGYVAFFRHMQRHFRERDTRVLVHLAPRPFGKAELHAPYREALEDAFRVIDLHRELHAFITPEAFIADGHYGPDLARKIGQSLAREVEDQLAPKAPPPR